MNIKCFLSGARALLLLAVLSIPGQASAAAELTEEENQAWSKGEISTAQHAIGGFVGTFIVPFGIGQAIEGRYFETGWIFTAGEISSLALMVGGLANSTLTCPTAITASGGIQTVRCDTSLNGLFWVGLIGYVGFRIWEIVDVWVGPTHRNAAYRRAKEKLQPGTQNEGDSWSPFVAPIDGSTLALGLQLRF